MKDIQKRLYLLHAATGYGPVKHLVLALKRRGAPEHVIGVNVLCVMREANPNHETNRLWNHNHVDWKCCRLMLVTGFIQHMGNITSFCWWLVRVHVSRLHVMSSRVRRNTSRPLTLLAL